MRLDLSIEFATEANHLDKLAAAELEVYVSVIAEDRRVVCVSVFKGFINVAVEYGSAYSWINQLCKTTSKIRTTLTLPIYSIDIFLCLKVRHIGLTAYSQRLHLFHDFSSESSGGLHVSVVS